MLGWWLLGAAGVNFRSSPCLELSKLLLEDLL